MAFNLGLRAAEMRNFQGLLCSHHEVEIRLQLMDLDHRSAGGEISARLVDGQVTFDATAAVSRALDMDLLDPNGALHLDSKSPDNGAMFADRMIQVRYAVINPLGTKRYTTPVFTGPLTKLERNGMFVKVEAQGKEIFGLTRAWNEKTFKKGYRVTSAILFILNRIMGENPRRIRIPNKRNKLPRNVSVGDDKLPWQVAKSLAASIGYHLFYDGEGICRMRRIPRSRVFTFHEGTNGSIKSQVDAGFSIDRVVNAVEVFGKKPKKEKGKTQKKRPHARAVAPRNHPLSPWALGRNGGPRYLPEVIEDDGITSNKEARRRANAELRSGLLESIDVAYDAVVIPYLEENDVVGCRTSKFSGNHRVQKFAIPLAAAGSMPVGYLRNVKPNASRIRVKQKRPTGRPNRRASVSRNRRRR